MSLDRDEELPEDHESDACPCGECKGKPWPEPGDNIEFARPVTIDRARASYRARRAAMVPPW